AGGPWIVMANILYENIGDSLPIGIINTAVGGTGLLYNYDPSVGQWRRNPSDPEDISSDTFGVYGHALRRFRQAGSEVEWITWIQGEADGGYGGVAVPQTYQVAFENLITDLESDLNDMFAVYHLQIGGDAENGAWIGSFPQVRESQRSMPPSTLVGTGLGLAVWDGRFHYNVPSLWSIGEMFAGAILKQEYHIGSPMYPPLVPDTQALLDTISDPGIPGRYCFSLQWNRDGKPAKLTTIHFAQYFALIKDGQYIDTSNVWYRIVQPDSQRVQIGLRGDSIDPAHNWTLIYDAAANADRAPLATIDPSSGDTIFATAFWDLPVSSKAQVITLPATSLSLRAEENPSTANITLIISGDGAATLTICDVLGRPIFNDNLLLSQGPPLQLEIPVKLGAGTYYARIVDSHEEARDISIVKLY
ncbi:MAG TPA: sialate O-acetylesterase, partial [Candidatus Kapabacteria bacterium]|nr:sialate O-acetylesterase [Candidatus Kapabacteria bacterium]